MESDCRHRGTPDLDVVAIVNVESAWSIRFLPTAIHLVHGGTTNDAIRVGCDDNRFPRRARVGSTASCSNIEHGPEVVRLMEYAENRVSAAKLLPRLEAIWLGDRELFGVIKLGRAGIGGPGFFASWSEVCQVYSDECSLYVDWSQRPRCLVVRYRDVAFPRLAMAISRILIEEHSHLPAPEA
jgi:hypothetical protein